MCRKNQMIGLGVSGFGLGLLAACFFESVYFCVFVAVAMLVLGVVIMQKK